MHALYGSDGMATSDREEMRRLAVDFYSALYTKEPTDRQRSNELFNNLPSLNKEHKKELDLKLSFEVVTVEVQLFSGCAPGIDGLPIEFYKTFWGIIGRVFLKKITKLIGFL
ncbi:mucin-5B-like [Tachysurus ichikawai]